MTLSDIIRLLQPIRNRIMLMIARGVLKVTNDKGGLQASQITLLEDETRGGVERFQNYGFTSHPQAGADVLAVFLGGNRDHGIILCIDDRRYRMKALKGGEVAVYTDEGDYIYLKRDRNIEVKSLHVVVNADEDYTVNTKKGVINASDSMQINTGKLELKGAQSITEKTPSWTIQSLEDSGTVTAKMRANLDQEGWHKSTGDQVAGGISQIKHVHSGVLRGCGTTDKPMGGV